MWFVYRRSARDLQFSPSSLTNDKKDPRTFRMHTSLSLLARLDCWLLLYFSFQMMIESASTSLNDGLAKQKVSLGSNDVLDLFFHSFKNTKIINRIRRNQAKANFLGEEVKFAMLS